MEPEPGCEPSGETPTGPSQLCMDCVARADRRDDKATPCPKSPKQMMRGPSEEPAGTYTDAGGGSISGNLGEM